MMKKWENMRELMQVERESEKEKTQKMILYNFKNKLKVSPLGVYLNKVRRFKRDSTPKDAIKAMERFGYSQLPETEKKKMYADMKHCHRKYGFSYYGYFRYRLMEKSEEERNEYVSDFEHVQLCEAFNRPENQVIFDDKSRTAEVFRNFFKREFLVVESIKDVDKLSDFLTRYKRAVVKPIGGAGGKGVKLVSVEGESAQSVAEKILHDYCGKLSRGAIVEEVIIQDERMSKLHPESVNTIRVPAFRLDDRTIIFHPFLRVGKGDSFVDNASSGGVYCPIDADTGVVILAADKDGKHYQLHPETNQQLVGYTIPEWEKAKEFVNKLVEVVPTNRYTGWDIALSKNGWVLVEANAHGQWSVQIALGKGFKREVYGYMDELKLRHKKIQ